MIRAEGMRPGSTGALRWKETPHDPHHHQPPAHGGDLRPGTVRARRWHGDGDVRGYRPPWAGRPAPTSPTFIPSRAAPCRVLCGGSSRRRNNRDRTAPRPFRPGRGEQSGAAVAAPGVEAKQPENITPPPSLPLWRRRILLTCYLCRQTFTDEISRMAANTGSSTFDGMTPATGRR